MNSMQVADGLAVRAMSQSLGKVLYLNVLVCQCKTSCEKQKTHHLIQNDHMTFQMVAIVS